MRMAATVFNDAGPFEQIDNIFCTEGYMRNPVKSIQKVSEKTAFKDFTSLYMCIAKR